jgi:hypothetical protein
MALVDEILHFVVKAPNLTLMYTISKQIDIVPSLNLPMVAVASIFQNCRFFSSYVYTQSIHFDDY